MVGKAARVDGPAIRFGFALNNHLSQQFASPASLNNTKGKDACLKRIRHARHRANQWQTVWRVGNRPIHHTRNTSGAQQRHPCAGIFNIPLEPLQIVIIELERKIIRHWITGIDPMRPAVFLIRAKQKPVLFLAQIIGTVRIAQQWQLCIAGGQFGNRFSDQILMRQRHTWHVTAKHAAQLCRPIASRIDHIFRTDCSVWRGNHPFILHTLDMRYRAEPDNFCAFVTRPFGKCLGQLRRVNITIQWIPLSAIQIMGFQKRIDFLHLAVGHFLKFDAHLSAHRRNMAKLLHPLAAMCQPDRASDMVIHRIIHQLAKFTIQLGRIGLDFHHRPGADKIWAIASRMPGRSRGQFVFLEKHAIGPAHAGQMIQNRTADSATTNDHNPCG